MGNTTMIARNVETLEDVRCANLDRHNHETVVEIMSRNYSLHETEVFQNFLEDHNVQVVDSSDQFGEKAYILSD